MAERRADEPGADDSTPVLSVNQVLSLRSVPKARLRGWVAGKAGVGGIVFIILRDGTGYLQVSAKKGVAEPQVVEGLRQVPRESVVSLWGEAREDRRAPGGVELVAKGFEVISRAEPWPIT